MDMRMPDIDGLEATRRIRSHAHLLAVPIIAMTANAMEADKRACKAAGMVDHISKPFDLEVLIRTLLRYGSPGAAAQIAAPRAPVTTQMSPSEVPVVPVVPDAPDVPDVPDMPVLDVEGAIARMGGDPAFYAKIVASFVGESNEVLSQVKKAVAQGRRADALRLLHTLAGLAGMVGASQLRHTVIVAEAALKALPELLETGTADGTPQPVQQIEAQLALAIRMLDARPH